ncbi:MAG: 2-oxo acid dehydrogenase subunit E2, partial [Oscillospiraceae bacterium]
SFAMVKILSKTEFLETTLKIYFDPSDTVFDVARKVDDAIQRNKHKEASNKTDKVVNTLLSIPGLLLVGTGILKLMDRYGIMPRMVVDASPFHTSMFITNMASIRLSKLHHHLYNFGTTTVFLGMGKREPQLTVKKDGTMGYRDVYPLAVTTDERVCAGAFYGMAFQELDKYLKNPELLEVPPESVRYDENIEYHLKKDKIH